MNNQASPGAQLFVAAGLFIISWRLLPAPDWHTLSKIMAALPGILGAALLIGAAKRSPRKGSPWWQGLIGRLVAVGTLWLVIVVAARTYGTPHILYRYASDATEQTCVYLGWKGAAPVTRRHHGVPPECAIFAWVR